MGVVEGICSGGRGSGNALHLKKECECECERMVSGFHFVLILAELFLISLKTDRTAKMKADNFISTIRRPLL